MTPSPLPFLALAFLLLVGSPHPSIAATRDAQWKSVDDAAKQGQPRTALERLQPILDQARAEKAWPEAVRALGRRIALETEIQGHLPEERITRLAAETATAPPPLQPYLHHLLARAYWTYFQQNRWRIRSRTSVAPDSAPRPANDAKPKANGTANAPANDDFRTWDLRRLFAEIDRQFSLALADAPGLQSIPITSQDALLLPGSVPDRYRPTLFDFLVHDALVFYTAGEQAGARPEDAFVVDAAGPVLSESAAFLNWTPSTTDTRSPILRAVQLHQAALRFHEKDADPAAFFEADLARLLMARGLAVGDTRESRFIDAAQALAQRAAGDEISARIRHEWASALQQTDRLVEAHAIATEGARVFPKSPGAAACRNLIRTLEAKSLRLATEQTWIEPLPSVTVGYRNLTRVHFRAIRVEWDKFLDRRQPRPDNLRPEQRLEFMRRPATAEWSVDLPPTADFQEREAEARPPASVKLPHGYYLLFASARPDFQEPDNALAMADIWVTDLALVVRPRAGQLEGFVLDARTGEPVAGATVESWELRPNGERGLAGKPVTDELGFFTFPDRPGNRTALLRAIHGPRQVALSQDTWLGGERPREREQRETLFFTDRALYRPGQLVQFKGICLSRNSTNDNYRLLPGLEVVVVFNDVNGKEIARRTLRANDYGSFSGTFTAPSDRLPGAMRLQTSGSAPGLATVQVEEYKRPKFHVVVDPPKSAPRLNDDVVVTGRATAYSGTPIDGAEVRWFVSREVRFPPWWGWFRSFWPGGHESREIAHGTARTDVTGKFEVRFPATPDLSVPEKDEPTFHFSVNADVTDGTGETRSGSHSVRVGYTALAATLGAADWQVAGAPVALRVDTLTLDGEGQAAAGTVAIHRLKQPDRVPTPRLVGPEPYRGRRGRPAQPPTVDPSDPNQWELGDVAARVDFRTDATGHQTNRISLGAGLYRAVLETRDRFGKTVTARLPIHVLDPAAARFDAKLPFHLAAPAWSVEPGAGFEALWGTGYEGGRAFVEIEHRDRLIERFWTPPGRTQLAIRQAVTEAMRGGFTVHVTQVRENRAHLASRFVEVPWTNKELDIAWETFRSKLEPGAKETWTAVIRRRAGVANAAHPLEADVAELVATLYDASLDAFQPHDWRRRFEIFPSRPSSARPTFANGPESFGLFSLRWDSALESAEISQRRWPEELTSHFAAPQVYFARRGLLASPMMSMSAAAPAALAVADAARMAKFALGRGLAEGMGQGGVDRAMDATPTSGGGGLPAPTPAPASVAPRRNLSESAFFLPHLQSNSNGVVRLSFTMPESVTEWRFLGFAHDRALRSGYLSAKAVTARDLMVQPNPPRFLREGDQLEFTVKLSNASDAPQSGRARLSFAFARDESAADTALGNTAPEKAFDLPPHESRTLSWKITVPDGCGFLTYRATAATGTVSDGEEGFVPVLSRRVYLTESLPLPIRGPGEKKFTFDSLAKSGHSRTLRHDAVTVQMVSNPAWYAVLALPYLMEDPQECTEQAFHRLYANALARHLAVRDPRIKSVFDQWRATPALDSPLVRNQDLKSLLIEETPWLRQANDESQARRNLGVLFESNRLDTELARAQQRLAELQLSEGGWPWFPGGPRNEFITLYIVTGFGHLRHLGVEVPLAPALQALPALDAWIAERHRRIDASQLDQDHLDATVALYLYGRSYFLTDQPIQEPHRAALDFYLTQARKHWVKKDRQTQGHLALALQRFSKPATLPADDTPSLIVRSLRERSVSSEEMGLFWRDTELGGWWYRAPIETQALMIEVFDEVARDPRAVEDLKIWLLKQKQTRDWKTTKATADAVHALLGRGTNLLASTRLVDVELGRRSFSPGTDAAKRAATRAAAPEKREERASPVEPGTGFFETRLTGADVQPALADIKVRKADAGIAWGSVHWQYFEDLSAVKAHEGQSLQLKKALFIRDRTKAGAVLRPLAGGTKVQVGDELVVRVELRADRDFEFVHLEDQRGSGTEPVNVLSGHRFQDGLGYYESTRDTASHFFIEYLPKGTYVFEYPVRVQHRGAYTAGVARVQCLYAPEFNAHSQGFDLRVE